MALPLVAIGFVAALGLYFARAETPAARPEPLQPPIGKQCWVSFRNDVYAYTGKPNSDLKIGGRIKAISDEWLVLDGQPDEQWIPRNVIFKIEIPYQPAK